MVGIAELILKFFSKFWNFEVESSLPSLKDISYWIGTEPFIEPNRTKPFKKTGVDSRLKLVFEAIGFFLRLVAFKNFFYQKSCYFLLIVIVIFHNFKTFLK